MPARRAASGFDPVAYTARPAARFAAPHASADQQRTGNGQRQPRIRRLREAEPLETRAADPAPTRPAVSPAQPLAQRHHRRERDDDRGQREVGDERAVERAAARRRPRRTTTDHAGIGRPAFASTPASTPQMANTEPTEMSISPVSMTSVAPSATISTGRLARKRSLEVLAGEVAGRGRGEQQRRARAMAAATETSRR